MIELHQFQLFNSLMCHPYMLKPPLVDVSPIYWSHH